MTRLVVGGGPQQGQPRSIASIRACTGLAPGRRERFGVNASTPYYRELPVRRHEAQLAAARTACPFVWRGDRSRSPRRRRSGRRGSGGNGIPSGGRTAAASPCGRRGDGCSVADDGRAGRGGLSRKGVTFCPHCDGPLFKGKRVAVIGGRQFRCRSRHRSGGVVAHVTVVEFLDDLRADEVLQEKAAQPAQCRHRSAGAPRRSSATGRGSPDRSHAARRRRGGDHGPDGVFVQIGCCPTRLRVACLELSERGEIVGWPVYDVQAGHRRRRRCDDSAVQTDHRGQGRRPRPSRLRLSDPHAGAGADLGLSAPAYMKRRVGPAHTAFLHAQGIADLSVVRGGGGPGVSGWPG